MIDTATIQEVQLRNRRQQLKARSERASAAAEAKVARSASRQTAFKNAARYVKEHRVRESTELALRRQAKANESFYVPAESKILFVVRIRGIIGVSPKVRRILYLLRLRQIHNGVFVKVNESMMKMIRMVEPFIAYGTPSLKTVRELIVKRGFAKVENQRIPITDNSIIERELGEQGIICMEDLINEIYTAGDNFKAANSFLWAFKLNSPKGGFHAGAGTTRHFMEGGDAGNREHLINGLVQQML